MKKVNDSFGPSTSLRSRVLVGAGWQVAGRLVHRGIGIVSMLILARLLTPEDFGVMAIAMLLVYFAQAFCDAGSVHYILQVKVLNEKVLGTAWALDILLKSVCALGIWICLPLLPEKFSGGTVGQVVAVLAFGLPLRSLLNPQLHVERRELRYAGVFRLQLTQKISGFVVVIALAVWLRSVWAIAISEIVATSIAVIMSHRVFARAPSLTLVNVKAQFGFSGWMLCRGVIGYVRATIDTFLVASYYPLDQVGRYNLAREISVLPATEIIQPAMEPLVPAFARSKELGESLARKVGLSLFTLGCLVAPLGIFLFAFADPLVQLLLGVQWKGTELLIEALIPLMSAYTLSSMLANLLLGIGKVRYLFAFDLVTLLVTVLVMTHLTTFSLEDFALYRGILALSMTVPILLLALKMVNITLLKSLEFIFAPWCVASLAIAPLYWLQAGAWGVWVVLPIGAFYLILYVITLWWVARFRHVDEPAWSIVQQALGEIRLRISSYKESQ